MTNIAFNVQAEPIVRDIKDRAYKKMIRYFDKWSELDERKKALLHEIFKIDQEQAKFVRWINKAKSEYQGAEINYYLPD